MPVRLRLFDFGLIDSVLEPAFGDREVGEPLAAIVLQRL
jgi:hypothetical protein